MHEHQAATAADHAKPQPLVRDPLTLDWDSAVDEREVSIPVSGGVLGARLCCPEAPQATVVMGHPGALAHLASRERFAASLLARAGFATLLVDLVTDDEDWRDASAGADVPLLALRLSSAAHWLASQPDLAALPLGLVGVDTAAPAALVAAAFDPARVFAIVTRGGHPERAGASLVLSHVPTLNIQGSDGPDDGAFAGTRWSAGDSHLQQRLVLPAPPDALREGRALDRVISASAAWFTFWLDTTPAPRLALTRAGRRHA